MRETIDRNPKRLKEVLVDEGIRKEYLGGASKSYSAAVKAFVKNNEQNALKTKPKGYDADHPDLPLLRLRNYTLGHHLTDEEVLGEKGMRRIAHLLASLKPFITYCNSIVMPDEEDDGADEEEEDSEQDEDAEQEMSDEDTSDDL